MNAFHSSSRRARRCQPGPNPPVANSRVHRGDAPAVIEHHMEKIFRQIAAELRVQERQVRTAVELLDGGATVPFIARYRKEATDGLDDAQLRDLETRLQYLRELEERRE